MPRLAFLAVGVVVAAALLHSMVLPMAKYQQVQPMTVYLDALGYDHDHDGIPDLNDRINK